VVVNFDSDRFVFWTLLGAAVVLLVWVLARCVP